jgi:predicted phage terminase large subunit-like protein
MRYIDNPGYRAIIFRRTSKELTGGGSIWEEMEKIYPYVGGVPRLGEYMDWRFPSGAVIECSHLQHEKNKYDHHGKQYAFIGFDELPQFTESQFWYLQRSQRSTCGVPPHMFTAGNPTPEGFVRDLVDWWIDDDGYAIEERSGVKRWFFRYGETLHWADEPQTLKDMWPGEDIRPMSFTFIPSKLSDNPILEDSDPAYRSRLMALPYVERMQQLHGNWNVRPSAGNYFQRHWFPVIERPEPRRIKKMVRAWDFAATAPSGGNTDPDWTRGILLAQMVDGKIVIMDLVSLRAGPPEVERALMNTASQDGRECSVALWQDPGAGGKADNDHKKRLLAGYHVVSEVATKDKVTYAGPASSAAERGDIQVVQGSWNSELFHELEGFPEGQHDDIVDALSRAYRHLTANVLAVPIPLARSSRETAGLLRGRKKGMWR